MLLSPIAAAAAPGGTGLGQARRSEPTTILIAKVSSLELRVMVSESESESESYGTVTADLI
jgi:hypothetical protein